MGTTFLMAFALMLVLEGVLPFVAPTLWRETFRRITQMTDGQIRFVGLSSIIVGLLLLLWARSWSGCYPSTWRTSSRPRRCASRSCGARCWICFLKIDI